MSISETETLNSNRTYVAQPAPLALSVRLGFVFLCTYGLLLAVNGLGQLLDPFIHYDDYPTLFMFKEGYYSKTLEEGRWFNYLWYYRGIFTPAWMNLLIFLGAWSLFVAALSLNLFRTAEIKYPLLFALFIALSPQMTLMTGWFNSLVPGALLMAAYAVIALFVTPRTGRLMMLGFVPVALQAYTPYPFLIYGICLLREDREDSFAEFMRTTLTFIAAFALGLLIIYSINYWVHGIFGVALAEWREPTPATSIAGLIDNLPKLYESVEWLYAMTGYGDPAISLVLVVAFVGSMILLVRQNWLEALAVLAAIGSGMFLLLLHALMEGILLPFRSTAFLWVFGIAAVLRAIFYLRDGRLGSAPFALALVVALLLASKGRQHFAMLSEWQAETRAIASALPAETETVYIYGGYLAERFAVQMPRDFSTRLEVTTGVKTFMCSMKPVCGDASPPFSRLHDGGPSLSMAHDRDNGVSYIRLPLALTTR